MTTAFSDDQYQLAYPPGIEYHWWSTARGWLIRQMISDAQLDNPVLLEVGCGKGLEVRQLRAAGIEVFGVELARVPPLQGMENVVSTGMDAVDLPLDFRRRVTGILLLDVIEHLPDPDAILRQLQEAFSNLEVVIVTVPACQEIWSNYDEFYGHQRRYSLQALTDLAKRMGWQQQMAGYFFKLTYPVARLLSALGIHRRTRIDPPAPHSRWIHRLIAYFCRLEYYLLPERTKGTSAYSVFRVKSGSGN